MTLGGGTVESADNELPARNGGSPIVDYSLLSSNRRVILERRKVALLPDRTGAYSSKNGDTISFVISPGSTDDWLDGRNSYIQANVQVTGAATNSFVYLPNGPAACFSQVQVVSASGQQLVNILDYSSIQQMFSEWTAGPDWKGGIGQIYGSGLAGDTLSNAPSGWDPARYITPNTTTKPGGIVTPAAYNPFTSGIPRSTLLTGASYANFAETVEQQPAGSALQLQQSLSSAINGGVGGAAGTSGLSVAFRLDLCFIFGNATLIPSQFFPLTLRLTLQNPTQSLSYVGVDNQLGPFGPLSTDPTNTGSGKGPVAGISLSAAIGSGYDLTFGQLRFQASLVKVSPKFREKVDAAMSNGTFAMNITNYYAALNVIAANSTQATINTTWAAHDNQALYVALVPAANENNLSYNPAFKFGAGLPPPAGTTIYQTAPVMVTSSQLLLNGRYWPPQPNTNFIDMFHDTLAAFNTHSENVAFSPISFNSYYVTGRNFVQGWLLDRDAGSSLTGQDSVANPVWTLQLYFSGSGPASNINVHTCIAYTQVLKVQKDGQIKIYV